MKVRLEKKNRVTIDFIELETENNLLRIRQGKIGKSGGPKSTRNCGSSENALMELDKLKNENMELGFVEVPLKNKIPDFDGIYDKAKWHSGGDFPDQLDQFQASVHTGMFITWLIDNELFDDHDLPKIKKEVELVKERKLTGAQFYIDQLDGTLRDDDITEMGNEFSYFYFDLEKGDYVNDYSDVLGKNAESLYHVEDTWEKYDKLKPVIDKRFRKWKNQENKKWWQLFKSN